MYLQISYQLIYLMGRKMPGQYRQYRNHFHLGKLAIPKISLDSIKICPSFWLLIKY